MQLIEITEQHQKTICTYELETSNPLTFVKAAGFQKTASDELTTEIKASPIPVDLASGITFKN